MTEIDYKKLGDIINERVFEEPESETARAVVAALRQQGFSVILTDDLRKLDDAFTNSGQIDFDVAVRISQELNPEEWIDSPYTKGNAALAEPGEGDPT